MMVFVSLLCIFLGAVFIYLVTQYPGYILIHVADTSVEMTFWFGLMVLLVCIAIIYFSIKLLIGSLSRVKGYRAKRTAKHEHAGLLHYISGDLKTAKKELTSASKNRKAEHSYLNSLIAARSALDLGLTDESQKLLDEAEKNAPAHTLAVNIGKARLLLAKKEYVQARGLLDGLSPREKKYPTVLDLLRQVNIQQQNWSGLIELLPAIKSSQLYQGESFNLLEENAYMSYLDSMVSHADHKQTSTTSDAQGDVLANLKACWAALPKHMKKNPRLIGLYCSLLHRLHSDELAEILIRKTLKDQWHSGLVELYGKLNVPDYKSQLTHAEAWLKQHADDAYLLFTLGRLSIKNSLWGKAKDYLDHSLKKLERPEVYAEFGALLERLGEKDKSAALYRRGLLVASQLQ